MAHSQARWPSPALLALPDGKVHMEAEGGRTFMVTKHAGELALWILSAHDMRTNFVQTQVQIAEPFGLSLPYMQAMTLGLLWANPPAGICLLGLGGGALARTLHHHFPTVKIDCVEVSPAVIRIAEEYFGLASDEQLHTHVADARNFLAASQEEYDLILIDVFADKGRIPRHLGTEQFFALCRSRLSPQGVVVMNISSEAPDHLSKAHTFYASFAHPACIRVSPFTTIWFGSSVPIWEQAIFRRRALKMQRKCRIGFPFVSWTESIEADLTLPGDVLAAPILHDRNVPGIEGEDAS